MKTYIYEIDSRRSYEELLENPYINEAAKIIRSGGLVAFPTETVYGLGANAYDEDAAFKIYSAKNRASDNPLIVHISDLEMLSDVAINVNEKAKILIDNYFPGPLTLILQKNKKIAQNTCSNLNTVGVRMPKNNIARALIKLSNLPIAAPSANLSGRPSPTNYRHVIDDLNGRVNMILCSENSEIGIESTIVDCTCDIPIILRPGAITYEMLNTHFRVRKNRESLDDESIPIAPGMKYKHYTPNTPVYLVPMNFDEKDLNYVKEILEYNNKRILYINENNPDILANIIFREFRNADIYGYDYIFVYEIKKDNIGSGVMNRIYKAISGDIYDLIDDIKFNNIIF